MLCPNCQRPGRRFGGTATAPNALAAPNAARSPTKRCPRRIAAAFRYEYERKGTVNPFMTFALGQDSVDLLLRPPFLRSSRWGDDEAMVSWDDTEGVVAMLLGNWFGDAREIKRARIAPPAVRS